MLSMWVRKGRHDTTCTPLQPCRWQGMNYLHSTPIHSHGNLSAYTCMLDARFMLKISDYGLLFFRDGKDLLPLKESDSERNFTHLLWRAPELLRQIMPPNGTQVVYRYTSHTPLKAHNTVSAKDPSVVGSGLEKQSSPPSSVFSSRWSLSAVSQRPP